MIGKGLGHSASEAGLQTVSLQAPHMSKSERLHRWADNLELRKQLRLINDAAFPTRDKRSSARADDSPLSIAFEDWAFRAEGLEGERVRDALAFFDVSQKEMRRIVRSSEYGRRTIPAAVVAARVRALAEQADGATVPQADVTYS